MAALEADWFVEAIAAALAKRDAYLLRAAPVSRCKVLGVLLGMEAVVVIMVKVAKGAAATAPSSCIVIWMVAALFCS